MLSGNNERKGERYMKLGIKITLLIGLVVLVMAVGIIAAIEIIVPTTIR